MSKLSETFQKGKRLITYITVGDPSLSVTEKLIGQLEKAGADIIELGVPFSDPLADGPVIQASHQRALKKHVALSDVFRLVTKVRKKSHLPICLMLSYNLVAHYGEEKFYQDCEKAGVDGVVIPDLPPEEAKAPITGSRVDRIFLVAPTSTDERIKMVADKSSGFIYLISVAGITGKRGDLPENLLELVERVRKNSKLPIAVGFGISTPAQALAVSRITDGVIVGSAIVELIAKGRKIGNFVASLKKAIDAR
jgi:tryptophan synthase alpha chain